jgi:DNA-binding GntR family transcriptional regulator
LDKNATMSTNHSPLELPTASTAVARLLQEEIERGVLQPGTRLRQSDLARRFGVSTTPVREALASLQAEGLVKIDAHRGAIVFVPTLEDMRQCFEVRRVLEPVAMREAAKNLSATDLGDLQVLIRTMRSLDDTARWLELNDTFHMTLYAPCGNDRLRDIIDSLRLGSRYYIHLYVTDSQPPRAADLEHQSILDACSTGDSEGAAALVEAHVDRTFEGVTLFMERGAKTAVS